MKYLSAETLINAWITTSSAHGKAAINWILQRVNSSDGTRNPSLWATKRMAPSQESNGCTLPSKPLNFIQKCRKLSECGLMPVHWNSISLFRYLYTHHYHRVKSWAKPQFYRIKTFKKLCWYTLEATDEMQSQGSVTITNSHHLLICHLLIYYKISCGLLLQNFFSQIYGDTLFAINFSKASLKSHLEFCQVPNLINIY